MASYNFDPKVSRRATDSREAVALAAAWANGDRSHATDYTPIYDHTETRFQRAEEHWRTVAIQDAQEVVKWSALAQVYLAMEKAHG